MAGVHVGRLTACTMDELVVVTTCDRGHVPAPVCTASTSSVAGMMVISLCMVLQP